MHGARAWLGLFLAASAAACTLLACSGGVRRTSPQGVQSTSGSTLAPRAIRPDIFSGPLPRTSRDLAALRAKGVVTLVHVDALRPDTQRALAAGLDTRHIPIRLAGATREQVLALGRVVRTARRRSEGVYFTSRDARVRAPAAAALAAIALGDITPAQGLDALAASGVELDARGMHRSVREALPASDADLDGLAPNAGEPGPEPTFAEAMASTQANLDVLRELQQGAPSPARESASFNALDIARDLRGSLEAAQQLASVSEPDFAKLLLASLARARALEDDTQLATQQPTGVVPRVRVDTELARRLREVEASCQACHAQYRDR